MRIAIMGAGGIGGYLAAILARAGSDVQVVARGANLAALRQDGLHVEEAFGEPFQVPRIAATPDPAAIGPVDGILFSVKLYDTEAAADACRPLLGENTWIATLQNGVETVDVLEARLGRGRTLALPAHFGATLVAPGRVRHGSKVCRLEAADPAGPSTPRLEALAALLRAAGADVAVREDARLVLWEKFVRLSANSAIAALLRRSFGTIQSDPHATAVWRRAVAETIEVGRAAGVPFGLDIEAQLERVLQATPPGLKPSMLVDLENGRRLELDWFSGAVGRLGRTHGVDTPVHDTVYAALRPYRDGDVRK